MKTSIFSIIVFIAFSFSSFSQGIFFEDNSVAAYDTVIGFSPNYTENLNLELLIGSSQNTINTAVVTLLLSSSAKPTSPALGGTYSAAGDISFFGTIYDISGQEYLLPSYAGETVYCEVLAWTGNYSTYTSALDAGASTAISQVFTENIPTGGPRFYTDISNVGIISFVPGPIPEPKIMSLAGLGVLSLSFLRCKQKMILG